MLTSDQLDALTVPITDLYDEYAQTVINDIARRLVKMGKPTATAAWQLQRLQESGKVYENAIKELSKLTGQSEKVLKETFEQAGVQTMRFDERVYKAAGLNPLPLHMSPAMARVLSAGLQKTGGLINNLTMTTANSAQQAFIHAADIAYMQVTTGTMSYDEAIRRAIKGVGDSGLEIIYPTGHRDKLDVAMRRTVLTGVSQTAGQLQWSRMDELGVDLVQVSAHIGARPEHQVWQGKIFSRSGTDKRYPDFVSSTGLGTVTGLLGAGCRHSYYAFFKGISKPIYDEATTDEYTKKTVTYNGQEVPIYEATQIQRGIERKIRAWKRQASALEAGGLSNVKEIGKVRQWQETMRDFIKQTGLQRQGVRERIVLPGDRGQPKIFKGAEKPKPPQVFKSDAERIASEMGINKSVNLEFKYGDEASVNMGEYFKKGNRIVINPDSIDKAIAGNPYIDREVFIKEIITHEYSHAKFQYVFNENKFSSNDEARAVFKLISEISDKDFESITNFSSYAQSYWRGHDYSFDSLGRLIAVDETLAEVGRNRITNIYTIDERLERIFDIIESLYTKGNK